MTEFTTMEKLQMKVGPSGAVLKYGEKVLVTCETYYGFTAEKLAAKIKGFVK